jgi:hypothetical protein
MVAPPGWLMPTQRLPAPFLCGDQCRRAAFPRPGPPKKMPGGYVVRDANGQALAYVQRAKPCVGDR